jgi:2-polyprenyl-3-methyl-5-hydroxy-6-metoxy-1,4-benzoquinol methylase
MKREALVLSILRSAGNNLTSDPLTPKSYWDERHHRIDLKKIYPDPRFYFLDFELDRVFQKHLSGMAGKKLLEMGCGSSVWLPYFKKEYGLDISGIDYSEEGIETCSEILRRNGIKGQLFKENIFELADGSRHQYDVVFSLGFIEHFKNPIHVLKTFSEYLSSSGLLITWIPNTSGLVTQLSALMNKDTKKIYCSLNLKELDSAHRSAGFSVIEGHYTQFLDFSLVNLLKLPKFWQRCFSRGFQLLTLPFLFLGNYLNVHIRFGFLSSGIVVVARKATVSV